MTGLLGTRGPRVVSGGRSWDPHDDASAQPGFWSFFPSPFMALVNNLRSHAEERWGKDMLSALDILSSTQGLDAWTRREAILECLSRVVRLAPASLSLSLSTRHHSPVLTLPNSVVSLRSEGPPAYGGRRGADSLASPGDGRTGARPKRRAARHDAGSARGERLRIEREEEMGVRTDFFQSAGEWRAGCVFWA